MNAALITIPVFLALQVTQAVWLRRRGINFFRRRPVLRAAVAGGEVAVIFYLVFAAMGKDSSVFAIALGTAILIAAYADAPGPDRNAAAAERIHAADLSGSGRAVGLKGSLAPSGAVTSKGESAMTATRRVLAAMCLVGAALAQPALAVKPKLYLTTPTGEALAAGTALLAQISLVVPSPSGPTGEACAHQYHWPLFVNGATTDSLGGLAGPEYACAAPAQELVVKISTKGKVTVESAQKRTRMVVSDPPCEWETASLTGTVTLPRVAEGLPVSGTAHRGPTAAKSCAKSGPVRGELGLLTEAGQEPVHLETR